MRRIILQREESSAQGTFGRIALPGLTLFSGELPWRDNRADLSCLPTGIYPVIFTLSNRFGRGMYLLTHTGGRTGIRFHSANLMGDSPPWHKQLNGCIALGEKIGTMDGQKALLVSRPAVRRFEDALGRQPFTLEIRGE